jgi:hypothetical protein
MKRYLLVTILGCLLLICSCTKLIMYHYGIRNPKIESSKSILSYLAVNNLDTSNVYALKDTSQLNLFFKTNIGVPEIRFYDHNGYLMLYRDEKKCNGQNDSLISFLKPENVIKVDSSNNLFEYIKNLNTLSGVTVPRKDFYGKDFYLIMYWAKYLGKTNSVKMKDWENTLMDKKSLKIKTIKVTVDYMDFWSIDKKDMIKIYNPKSKVKESKK